MLRKYACPLKTKYSILSVFLQVRVSLMDCNMALHSHWESLFADASSFQTPIISRPRRPPRSKAIRIREKTSLRPMMEAIMIAGARYRVSTSVRNVRLSDKTPPDPFSLYWGHSDRKPAVPLVASVCWTPCILSIQCIGC